MHTRHPSLSDVDRRPTHFRDVVVTAREEISEHMLRLTLCGDDLMAVVHDSPSAWIKLFVTEPDGFSEHGRAYTVRGFDPFRDEITIDVFLHTEGTMANWARNARIGEQVQVAGPRSSGTPQGAATPLVLFGDETSLPAIATTLEREHSGRPISAFIELTSPGDQQDLALPRGAHLTWLHRKRREAPGSHLVAAATQIRIENGAAVWFAGEARSANPLRAAIATNESATPGVRNIHTRGYWRYGIGDYRE